MRKLTKKEWLREWWWTGLLYLVLAAIVIGIFDGVFPFIVAGICAWLIANDSRLVGRCLNCGKTLVVVEDTCSRCGAKTAI